MVSTDLKRILENFDSEQMEVIETIASRLAGMKMESYSGEISFSLHAFQGSISNVHVNRKEVLVLKKKGRLVRSGGV